MRNRPRTSETTTFQVRRKRQKRSGQPEATLAGPSASVAASSFVANLVRDESQVLKLLREVAHAPMMDALRPGLLQYLELHERALLHLEAWRRDFANGPVEPSTSMAGTLPSEVIIVTDADILPEEEPAMAAES